MPDRVFEEAGKLAGYYSSGRDSDKLEIDYLQKKNVKKTGRKCTTRSLVTGVKCVLYNPEPTGSGNGSGGGNSDGGDGGLDENPLG